MKFIVVKMVVVMIVLGVSSVVCVVVNLYGEVGVEFINLFVSFGVGELGMMFSFQWVYSDNDGDSVGLGMGYNFNFGFFLMILGGKVVYLNLKDGDEGYVIVVGGGVEFFFGQYFMFFGEGYYLLDLMFSGVEDYVEVNVGVCFNVFFFLNIEVGYCYIDMVGKDGNCDNMLVDGVYVGVNFCF